MKSEAIAWTKNLAKIQRLFTISPAKKFRQSDIRKETKLSKITVIKWLGVLETHKFVKTEQIGRTKLYYANLEHPVVRQYKILTNVSLLYEAAQLVSKNLECEIYLFGSAARGEDTEKSDIDILIIGDKVPQNTVISIISPLEKQLKKRITFQIFTRLEWAQASRKDKPFYERVERDKIRLA